MKTTSLKDAYLTNAKDAFLLYCHVAGVHYRTRQLARGVLSTFIGFTGDIRVREITPGLVRAYMAPLSKKAGKNADHDGSKRFSRHSMLKHYQVIRTWIRWIYLQEEITERYSVSSSPRLAISFDHD